MNKTIVCTALAAALLSACGGSDDEDRNKFAPGDEFSTELSLDDTLVETSTYRVYGISNDGELVTNSDNLASDGLIPIEIERTSTLKKAGFTPKTQEITQFVPLLMKALQSRHADKSMAQIAQEVHDLDISLADIYENYLNSGLHLTEFVDFYETLDEYPLPNENEWAEADLSQFLLNTQVTPRQLLDALHQQGRDWRQLLELMVDRQDDFNSLYQQYKKNAFDVSTFVHAYFQVPVKAFRKDSEDKDTSALDVAKFVWKVIKDNRPETVATGAFTRVLSSKDTNYENYEQVKSGKSQEVTLKAKNRLKFLTLYDVKFELSGYYNAQNPNIPGNWMPLLSLDVNKMDAIISWKINATARVTLPVNVGTVAAPTPEMPVVMEINQSGLLQNYTDAYIFRANGKDGFSYVGKK